MAKEHELYIEKFLDEHSDTAFIGGEIVDILKKEYPELTDANCRRIINNACMHEKIASSKPLTFANNQYAYFSKGTALGYKILANAIRKYKKPLHRVIFALTRNGGMLSFLDAQKISGATLADESHSVSFATIIEELRQLQIADVHKIYETDFLIQGNVAHDLSILESCYSELKNTNLLLMLSLNWLIRSNLIDGRQICYMGEKNAYNGIERNNEMWDAFGFSNAVGIGAGKKNFETVVLVDFLPNHTYEEYDFRGFKERIDRVVFSTKGEHRKVLPVIFSYEISPSAASLIKSHGYLYFNISSLLGENSLRITKNYIQNIQDIEQKLSEQNTEFEGKIIESLTEFRESGNEINYSNLKGTLFEYLMYPVIQKIYDQNCIITHGYKGSVEGQTFECDYLVETRDENIIFELKGYRKGSIIVKGDYDQEERKYTPNSILWFLNNTFHRCSQKLGKQKKNKLCYITTADLEEKAKNELVSRKKNKPEKLECFYNFDSLLALLKKYDLKNEIMVIKQFYA